jgi:NAD-dependent SIR2 family protein deacetylase
MSNATPNENIAWKCSKCDVSVVVKKTVFDYLGNTFSHEVPVCPKCGKVFIPKELALGKMSEVEHQLEDK